MIAAIPLLLAGAFTLFITLDFRVFKRTAEVTVAIIAVMLKSSRVSGMRLSIHRAFPAIIREANKQRLFLSRIKTELPTRVQ